MKSIKYIILLMLTGLPILAFAKKDGMARFSGTINNYHQGNLVVIVDPQGNIADDTLQIDNNGKFSTAIAVTSPTELLFNIEQPRAAFKLYATPNSNGKLNITLLSQESTNGKNIEVGYEGSNKEIFDFIQHHDFNDVVLGKYSNEKMKSLSFADYKTAVRADIDKLKSDLATLKDKQYKLTKEAEWERKYTNMLLNYAEVEDQEDKDYTEWWTEQDFDNNLDIALVGVSRFYKLAEKSGDNNYDVEFIKGLPRKFSNQKTCYACADQHIVNVMAKAPVNTDQIFATYRKLYAGHEKDIPDYVLASYEEAKKNVAGKLAPDFEMEDENGNKIMLSSLRGKLLYIDIWATWCAPCKAEIPNMKKLAEHYKDDPSIMLLSISIDSDTDRWKQTMSTTEKISNWAQYHVIGALESDFCKRYNVVGIPRFLLIDRDGKVVSLDAPRPGEAKTIELIDLQ